MSKIAIDVASSCSNRFLEGYTAILPPEQEDKLREIVGDWEKIMRPRVEQPDELLELARNDFPKQKNDVQSLSQRVRNPTTPNVGFLIQWLRM